MLCCNFVFNHKHLLLINYENKCIIINDFKFSVCRINTDNLKMVITINGKNNHNNLLKKPVTKQTLKKGSHQLTVM